MFDALVLTLMLAGGLAIVWPYSQRDLDRHYGHPHKAE